MDKRIELLNLVKDRDQLKQKLNSLVYGTPEIRERNGKKYLYVHYREDGLSLTKYVNEYSDDLYNNLIYANNVAKTLKKQLREINKQLKSAGYNEENIDEKVSINIDFARKYLVDTIYKQAVLEGIATTYADTETIVEGGKVNNMTADDVLKVVNLKRAWEFITNKDVIMSPTNFALLCEINKLVEEGFYYNAGKIRTTPVSIGGTDWKPQIPIENDIKDELNEILSKEQDVVDTAIDILLYIMKRQIFIDGNKRTAVIFANHLLIKNARGLIVIPDKKVEEYKKLLISFYEKNDIFEIKSFLKKYAYIKI